MSAGKTSDASFFGGLFGRRKKSEPKSPEAAGNTLPQSTTRTKRVICFRIDDDLYRRISRALRVNQTTRPERQIHFVHSVLLGCHP